MIKKKWLIILILIVIRCEKNNSMSVDISFHSVKKITVENISTGKKMFITDQSIIKFIVDDFLLKSKFDKVKFKPSYKLIIYKNGEEKLFLIQKRLVKYNGVSYKIKPEYFDKFENIVRDLNN